MGIIKDKVNQAKVWWKSKTIIGTIIMLAPALLKVIAPDVDIDVKSAVDEVWTFADGISTYGDSIWSTVTEAIGFVIAVYGRFKADVGIKPKVI